MLFVLLLLILGVALVRYVTRRSHLYKIPDDIRRSDDCGVGSNSRVLDVNEALGAHVFGSGSDGGF
jgi:flagellar biogenesis protein FliO